MSPGYSVPYMWNYMLVLHTYTKSTSYLATVGLLTLAPYATNNQCGFSPVTTIGLGINGGLY